ncbi:MAG: FadD3 family acyl-CoA ligase [Acidimicrobiales bacterium]
MPGGPRNTIPAVLDQAAVRYAGREALVDGELRLGFPELAAAADSVARALVACGVAPGDRVAIWAPNGARWVASALGTYRAGAVVVTLNTRLKAREAGHVLRTAGVRLLFMVDRFLGTDYGELLAGAGPLPALGERVALGDEAPPGGRPWDDFLAGGATVPAAETAARAAAVAPGDVSDVLFTSGTTGAPKGAMLGHEASVRAFLAWSDVVGLTAGDRYLVINPFFHTFGLKAGILAGLLRGATLVPQAVFEPDAVLRRVADERITVMPGPPTVYQSLLEHPARAAHDLSSLRLAVTGAAVVPVDLVRRMRDELGFDTVVTGYGLTECTGIATMCRHGDDPETIARTSGRAIDGVEVVVADDTGAEVPAGTPGEVLVRGYNVMHGYIGDPEATAEAIDSAGWLHTGDVGVMDERGYLRITDRKKDMYIVGGFNVYPAEVEAILLAHPGIAQVAVVAMADERLGEVGRAFVVPRRGVALDPEEVVAWSRREMANYKVPRLVELVDELPLNASGKVTKYELRARPLPAPAG